MKKGKLKETALAIGKKKLFLECFSITLADPMLAKSCYPVDMRNGNQMMAFDEWLGSLGIDCLASSGKDLLKDMSMKEIEGFFISELLAVFNTITETTIKEAFDKASEEKEDGNGNGDKDV